MDPADYIKTYTYGEETNAFTFREFVYFDIEFNSKRIEDEECKNCLLETRKLLKEFFEYADCADKGQINSEMLFKATKNLQSPFPVTTSMTNDFILKTMEISSATIDLREFSYGMMSGYMERLFAPDGGTNVASLKDMTTNRAALAKKGDGPKRRRV